ncbi:MAG: ACP S-malonyltransferase [Verrucomicrobia bacterium]|nr:ACP S-malonyltransferase [Verrucomicrobiota bacterium]MCF7707533.1 ACP S-malonyltransferase [Verrucomicrobiota bacterium]
MRKTALLFAGQGAQKVGMGKDLFDGFDQARELFGQANGLLGYDLASICFEGPAEELTQTEHSQPAIFLVGWVAYELLRSMAPGLEFNATAGLSLGEFTALCAAGAMDFGDGLKVVRRRGRLMQEACEKTDGAMAALIGLDEKSVREICEAADVELANMNCPGQVVVSGEKDAIDRACGIAKEKGAKRALPLPVAGAYHSRLMQSAQNGLAETLESVSINPTRVPVISNVTASAHEEPNRIRQLLVRQVTHPVLWELSMRRLIDEGYDRFIELGPGTTLSGFLKRIGKNFEILNVSDTESLKRTLEAVK